VFPWDLFHRVRWRNLAKPLNRGWRKRKTDVITAGILCKAKCLFSAKIKFPWSLKKRPSPNQPSLISYFSSLFSLLTSNLQFFSFFCTAFTVSTFFTKWAISASRSYCPVQLRLRDSNEMASGAKTYGPEHEGKEQERLDQDRTRQKVRSPFYDDADG